MNLSTDHAKKLTKLHGSPLYVYSRSFINDRADQLLGLHLPYGLTVRYAVKANSHPEVIQLFNEKGLHFDASSSYEAENLLRLGVKGDQISLSSQQPATNLDKLLEDGVRYVATSLRQIELLRNTSAMDIGLRINSNVGYGHNNRSITAGIASSFGIWHEYLGKALNLSKELGLKVTRLHVHGGTGADPLVWGRAIDTALRVALSMPDVTTLDIGGGYKIAYTSQDSETDMQKLAEMFSKKIESFAAQTGRKLHLEVEPGRWLVAPSGCLVAEVIDVVDTGKNGYTFLRTNTGMNDIVRPMMYGAQHRIRVLNSSAQKVNYVVVGHNCETGDILTPAPNNPEDILPRSLNKAEVGDLIIIEDTGAYCAAMSVKGYNSFPQAEEVFVN